MGSQGRKPKRKPTNESMKSARLLAQVYAPSIAATHSSARDEARDQAGDHYDDSDSARSSVERWSQGFGGLEATTPVSSQIVIFGQDHTICPSDWVLVATYPEKESESPPSASRDSVGLSDAKPAIIPGPTPMRPPELRSKPTTPWGTNTSQGPERVSNTKRMSVIEPDQDKKPKRTRSDPDQNPVHWSMAEGDRDEDDNDSDATSRAQDQQTEGTSPALSFACPYYRRNPVAHQNCLNYTLKRIRDMKQHLSRKHYGATCYCPVCFRTFASFKFRDDHIRGRNCVPKPSLAIENIDAVSPTAQELLKQRVDRTSSPEDQWHAVYEILFGKPGNQQVDPYIRSVVRETLGMVRAFLRANGSSILPNLLDSDSRGARDVGDFERIMHDVFHEVETHFDNNSEQRRSTPRSSSTRPASSSSMTQEQTPDTPIFEPGKMLFAEPLNLSNPHLNRRRPVYHPSPLSMFKSNTFPGANDMSSMASPINGNLSRSWPCLSLDPLDHPPVGNAGFAIPEPLQYFHGYNLPESVGYPPPETVTGFARVPPPVFPAAPTISETDSSVDPEYAWPDDGHYLTGVGSAFHDSGYRS